MERSEWLVYPKSFNRNEKRELRKWLWEIEGRKMIRSIPYPIPFYTIIVNEKEVDEIKQKFEWVVTVEPKHEFYVNIPPEYK